METLRFNDNSNPYIMKTTLMILFAILCATMAFGQIRVRVTNTIQMLTLPDLTSPTKVTLYNGDTIDIGSRKGDFWQAQYRRRSGYLYKNSLDYCKPIDTTKTIDLNATKAIDISIPISIAKKSETIVASNLKYGGATPGDELFSAGKLLLTGSTVALGGGILSAIVISRSENLEIGAVIGIGAALTGVIMQIAGYRKLMRAGEKFNIGATSSGIGMTINLNK